MWSFTKSGIFTPGGKAGADTGESGGILAVWGSTASGKTTVAIKLARLLADKGKPTTLILCDMTAPMLPCICPGEDLENERSLGSLLAAEHPSEALIRHNGIAHKRCENLLLFGLLKGENEMSCPRHSYEQAVELLRAIEGIAPYVIVDCSSYISGDMLSSAALMEADCVLRLSVHDLKSVSYFSSQLPLLKAANWDAERQMKVASNIMSDQKIQDAADCVLYHSPELAAQFQAGNLFENLSQRDSRAFNRELKKICREVFGC